MRSILISLDSLNRHFLDLYGAEPGASVPTPNLDRLADASFVFEKHFAASAPCMPARREFMTGKLELRHRGWGPLEPWDQTLPALLVEVGCQSMLVTDHYHYFEKGGENYHTDFTGYEFIRGHEEDNWKTGSITKTKIHPLTHSNPRHERSRATFRSEEDFPTYRTFEAARQWVRENRDTESSFLFLDLFDPHEPFFVPSRYLDLFDDSGYNDSRLEWPRYGPWEGSEQELRHVRNRYRAKIAFIDDQLGHFLDTLADEGLYDETTIILTTDHGHYLGEHGLIGKPPCDPYNTLFHIPLIIKPSASLGVSPSVRRISALTSTPDLFATICDLHGASVPEGIYGKSILPVLREEQDSVRDYALFGYFGSQLGFTDGRWSYWKTPVPANQPLFYYTTRLTSHPAASQRLLNLYQQSKDLRLGRFLPEETDLPLLRFRIDHPPMMPNEPSWQPDALFDIEKDPHQLRPIRDEVQLESFSRKIAEAMSIEGFPEEHFVRLGLPLPSQSVSHNGELDSEPKESHFAYGSQSSASHHRRNR